MVYVPGRGIRRYASERLHDLACDKPTTSPALNRVGLYALDNARCLIVCVAMSTTIIHGDCLEELKKLDDCSVDAVISEAANTLDGTGVTERSTCLL